MAYFQRLPEPMWPGPRRLRIPPGEWQPPEPIEDDQPLTFAERWHAHRMLALIRPIRRIRFPFVELMLVLGAAALAWCLIVAAPYGLMVLSAIVFVASFAKLWHRLARDKRLEDALAQPLPVEELEA